MARFDLAIGTTLLWEGGYSDNPNDSGGETYRGISRNNWPTWVGWDTVDSYKAQSNFPKVLDSDTTLQGLVVTFYRVNFWIEQDVNDQQVAAKVFDLSVNIGKVHAVKIVQIAAGVTADGTWGPNTLAAINLHPQGSLTPLVRIAAENYHKEIVVSHPEDAIFLNGWLRRDDS